MERRKRQGASLAAPLAGRKRRRSATGGDWASLPSDIVQLVTQRLIDTDVADYVSFRAVCSSWRACTSMDLRAESWIALCDGDAVWPEDAGEIALFHTRTAMRVRVCLPKKHHRGYRIVGLSAGLLVLLHKRLAKVRVLHPFTRVAADFPSLPPVYGEAIKYSGSFRSMNAAVCRSAASSSIAVVLWFPRIQLMLVAEAGSDRSWDILHRDLLIHNTLVFQGRLYATITMECSLHTTMGCSLQIVQLYPAAPTPLLSPPAVVAHVPNSSGHHPMTTCSIVHLAESNGTVLVVVQHEHSTRAKLEVPRWWQRQNFTIYAVDVDLMNDNNGRWKLTPMTSLGDRALFLGKDGCISVSATDLPSLSRNSVYFSTDHSPIVMHSLTTGLTEDLARECQIHDKKKRIRPSVRPYTIVDHLLTFCHPKEWTKGLMFHEYRLIPESFTELLEKIRVKDSQLRIPSRSSTEPKRILQQEESTVETARSLATELKHGAMSLAESIRMLAESNKRRVETNRELEDALISCAESNRSVLVESTKRLVESISHVETRINHTYSHATSSRSKTSMHGVKN